MNTQVAWWYNNTWPYVFISATPVTVCWAVAAGFPFFTQPSIWTHISTNHSQGGPADHNPLLHLEGGKQKAHKWKVKLAEGGDFSFTDHHDKWYLYIKILHTFLILSGHKEFDNHARAVMPVVSRYIPYVCLQKKPNLGYLVSSVRVLKGKCQIKVMNRV